MKYVADVLDEIGLSGERAIMVNVSSAMGAQFAQIVTEFTDTVRGLGPNPLKEERSQ